MITAIAGIIHAQALGWEWGVSDIIHAIACGLGLHHPHRGSGGLDGGGSAGVGGLEKALNLVAEISVVFGVNARFEYLFDDRLEVGQRTDDVERWSTSGADLPARRR